MPELSAKQVGPRSGPAFFSGLVSVQTACKGHQTAQAGKGLNKFCCDKDNNLLFNASGDFCRLLITFANS